MASWAVAGWACGCQTGGGLYGRTLLETHVSCRVSHTARSACGAGRGTSQASWGRPSTPVSRRMFNENDGAAHWGAGMIVACVPVPRSAIPGNDYLGIIRVLPIPPCGCRLRCRCHTAPHRRGLPCGTSAGRPRSGSGRVTAGPDPAAARAAPPAGRTDGCRARGAGGAGRTTRERGDGRRVSTYVFDLSGYLARYDMWISFPRLANIQLRISSSFQTVASETTFTLK